MLWCLTGYPFAYGVQLRAQRELDTLALAVLIFISGQVYGIGFLIS